MTKAVNHHITSIIKSASKQIDGEWVLLGGSILPFLGINDRITMDVDLVPLGPPTTEHTIKLMDIAKSHGLPIEAINHSSQYFLLKIKNYKNHLITIINESNFKLYIPDIILYTTLKLNRCSESDLLDIQKYIKYCDPIDRSTKNQLRKIINQCTKDSAKSLLTHL